MKKLKDRIESLERSAKAKSYTEPPGKYTPEQTKAIEKYMDLLYGDRGSISSDEYWEIYHEAMKAVTEGEGREYIFNQWGEYD
jgi:hypothetical protein